jgi:importin-5
LFGEASGKDTFAADAVALMNSLSQVDPESGSMSYVMRAWVRIARCLGDDFAPFLPHVISKLLKSLSQSIEIPEVDDPDDLEDQPDVEIIDTDDGGWVAIRTSLVEEQSSALRVTIQSIYCNTVTFYFIVYTIFFCLCVLSFYLNYWTNYKSSSHPF